MIDHNVTSGSPFPFWVPFFVIGLWMFVNCCFAVISGWRSLARRFRAPARPGGQRVWGQVRDVGIAPEQWVTHLIVSQQGLYLYRSFLFRFLHPALLIPWSEVRLVREVKMLWWYSYQLELGQITRLRVTQMAYDAMRKYLTLA
jgi:hypothetical protein